MNANRVGATVFLVSVVSFVFVRIFLPAIVFDGRDYFPSWIRWLSLSAGLICAASAPFAWRWLASKYKR